MRQAISYWPSTQQIVLTVLLISTACVAFAQERGCIDLKTSAEIEQEYVDAKGQKATRLVAAGKVLPGDEVIWTVTARNVCKQRADRIVIANPVPEHMIYVPSSAMGIGTEITYSLDGSGFQPATALTVREPDGTTRTARADEYRAIRWTYSAPFEPGATAFVRYRATVK